MIIINLSPVAKSGLGGGAFPTGPFRVLSQRNWDFLQVFWEKVDFFTWFFWEGGLFRKFTACRGHVRWENIENMIENYALRYIMI